MFSYPMFLYIGLLTIPQIAYLARQHKRNIFQNCGHRIILYSQKIYGDKNARIIQ